MPTRRELVFILSLLAAVAILFQCTSDTSDFSDKANDLSWVNKVVVPWFYGEIYDLKYENTKTIGRPPLREPLSSDGTRDSQLASVVFGDQPEGLPATEILVHTPGELYFVNVV
jgi:hypothetical protein